MSAPLHTLKGRVAVVTGSSRGIGRGIAIELAQRGAKVTVNYANSHAAADAVVQELKDFGTDAIAVKGDVTKQEDIENLFTKTMEAFGRVDIVVSNSGIESWEAPQDLTPERFDQVFSLNTRAQLFVAVTGQKYMAKSNPPAQGRIILTSSVAARVMGIKNHTLYAASKAAVEAIVRGLATDWGPQGITVNAIAPGGTKSDMMHENARHYIPGGNDMTNEQIEASAARITSLGRMGTPQDIGRIVSWLASEDSGWITGQTLVATGGGLRG